MKIGPHRDSIMSNGSRILRNALVLGRFVGAPVLEAVRPAAATAPRRAAVQVCYDFCESPCFTKDGMNTDAVAGLDGIVLKPSANQTSCATTVRPSLLARSAVNTQLPRLSPQTTAVSCVIHPLRRREHWYSCTSSLFFFKICRVVVF